MSKSQTPGKGGKGGKTVKNVLGMQVPADRIPEAEREDADAKKYDPRDFVYPASDHHGHSERIWFRVQPLLDRQLEIVANNKVLP
ncbi:hypothetical protein LCGC14_2958100, partial [marine sediment metagenome]